MSECTVGKFKSLSASQNDGKVLKIVGDKRQHLTHDKSGFLRIYQK